MPIDDTHEPQTVNLSTPDAAAYWARKLQVPVETLGAAVEAVGHDAEKVAAHLGLPWPYEASGIV
ncbi:DUF3606 domain-containing protein [Methylobacterium sp. E-041]|jgi:hypothetical protein|uniref:DUF3606 domain-containing protein n=1 Tax=unclassified Methylobacterium TaxID=2615210 RepID=UPI0011C8FB99|nr:MULTISPECIES: DUF3606 domain-containing protein [unclassified Methylobacterium]MCJ2010186.1 DUF3606 domain-containing protein [Methylobacterium sp. J-092]MCJ2038941.1 DUF3606 domain-containing protein [Methylobacterium sp. J-059]MCJ2078615.1 DUF3606 domain-containing protein [Methylobacterium sp. E-016]MCJ2108771.1 DUF3606 domain-containing protein [Methylobacterium sp. E-041]MCJ2110771.1 DUF3606 domain-containing protein [Methylobacterium sp. E-025]